MHAFSPVQCKRGILPIFNNSFELCSLILFVFIFYLGYKSIVTDSDFFCKFFLHLLQIFFKIIFILLFPDFSAVSGIKCHQCQFRDQQFLNENSLLLFPVQILGGKFL